MSKTLIPEARHAKRRPRRIAFTIFKVLGLAMSVLLVAGLSLGYYLANSITQQVQTFDLGDPAEAIPKIGAYDGPVTMLLVGSDARTGESGTYGKDPGSKLNDVNILFHLSADHSKATVISIPRDTYVDQPECKSAEGNEVPASSHVKINSILEYGGARCVRDTVAQLTDMEIPYVGLISFDGVIAVSNAVGGVPVCVAQRIDDDYTGLHLAAGTHNLRGSTALKFLRTRHGVGDGSDLTRISSQQVYLSALVRKLKSSATLTDLSKIYPLAQAVSQNVTLSSSLNNADTLVTIAQALAPIDLAKVVFVQLPTNIVGDGVEVNQSSAKILFKAVAQDKTLKVSKKTSAGDPNLPGSVTVKGGGSKSTPAPTKSASPTPTPTPTKGSSDVVELPSSIPGQTAAEQTCSVGNGFNTAH